jgi:hypothetical protein
MEITAINRTATYKNVGGDSQTTGGKKTGGAFKSKGSPDYKVSLSSEGRQKSLSSFNRTQQTGRNAFERGQNADRTANNSRLENEKTTFERKQAAEEMQFENSQSLKKMQFMRGITRNAS